MGWGDIFGSIVEGVTAMREGRDIMGDASPWGGSEGAANAQPVQANATVDRVLAGRRTELNINDQ